jgi:hypothetical protein
MGYRRACDPSEGWNLVDRAFLRRLAAITGLVLAGMWLLMVMLGGLPVPGWLPPCVGVALGAAMVLF